MGIEIIGKLTQKNNGDFKLVDLADVDYDGTGKSAKQELENKIEEAKNSSTPYDDSAIKADINNIKTDLGTEELTTTSKKLKGAINELGSQIKEKANKDEVIKKGYGTLSDFNEETRAAIQGLEPGQINAVLGKNNVKIENTDFFKIHVGKNLFNKNAATDLFTITDNKGFAGLTSTNKFASEWIEIPGNTDITFSGQTGNGYVPSVEVYFSSSNTDINGFISKAKLTSDTGFTITSPAEAKYLRCSLDRGMNAKNLNTFQIEIGSEATAYEAFSKVVKLEVEGLDLGIPDDLNGKLAKIDANKNNIDELNNRVTTIEEQSNLAFKSLNKWKLSMHNIPSVYSNYNVTTTIEQVSSDSSIANYQAINLITSGQITDGAQIYFGKHKMMVDGIAVKCANKTFNATSKGGNYELSFAFDGDEFEIIAKGWLRYRMLIDDGEGFKYVNNDYAVLGANDGYRKRYKFSFESKKYRKIIFEFDSQNALCNLGYNKVHPIHPMFVGNRPKAIFIGSSITESSSVITFPHYGFPYLLSQMLGFDCINQGIGATGIVAKPEGRYSVSERFDIDVLNENPDILFLGGTINDTGEDMTVFQTAVDTLMNKIKTQMPSTTVIVLGTFVPKPVGRESNFNPKNDYFRQKALENNFIFIDSFNGKVYNDKGEVVEATSRWIEGSGQVGKEKNDGNCDVYLGTASVTDGTHLNREGHLYIAQRLASSVLKALY